MPARLCTEATPRVLSVPTVLGLSLDEVCAGIDGHPRRLHALAGGDGDLFVIFADATNGVATYGGGRFLRAEAPDAEGHTLLDFNRAYNPPCAFTSFATCPLPAGWQPAWRRRDGRREGVGRGGALTKPRGPGYALATRLSAGTGPGVAPKGDL